MASSGQITGGNFGGGYIYIQWSQAQNVSGNYSTITWQVCLRRDSEWRVYATKSGWINVNSNVYNFNCTVNGSAGNVVLFNGATIVNHNSDGTKSIPISAQLNIGMSWSGTPISSIACSGTATLDTIPRGTKVTNFYATSADWRSITFNFTTAEAATEVWVHINDGDRTGTGIGDVSSGSFTISGLSANTTYNFQLEVIRNGASTYSSTITNSTKSGCNAWKISSSTTLDPDSNMSFNFTNPNSAKIRLILYVTCADSSGVQQTYANLLVKDIGTINGNYTWTFTTDERNKIYSTVKYSNTATCKMYMQSFIPTDTPSSSNYISIGNYDFNISINSTTYKPTFSTLTATIDSTTTGVVGNSTYLIQNISNLVLSALKSNMTALKSADLNSFVLTCNGSVSTYSLTSGTTTFSKTVTNFTSTGSYVIKAYVTDSRGNKSTEITKTYTVLSYKNPVIVPKVVRALSSGGKVDVSFTAAYSRLIVSSTDKNSVVALKYGYAILGTEPTAGTAITGYTSANASNGIDKSLSYSKSGLVTLNENKNYGFKFVLQDKLTTTTVAVDLVDGNPLVRVLDTGQMGINTKPDTSNLDEKLRVGGDARILGSLTANGITSEGQIREQGEFLAVKYATNASVDGFVNPTNFIPVLESGVTLADGTMGNLSAYRTGNIIIINFSLRCTANANTQFKLFTIPEGYRPAMQVFTSGHTGLQGAIQIRVDLDGQVYVWNSVAFTTPRGTIVYTV